MMGSSSYVVLDTDYSTSALLCTCQEVSVFSLFYVHRVSCSLLQRSPEEDIKAVEKVCFLLFNCLLELALNSPQIRQIMHH